ncbi:MAG TPA: hypothetical protein VGS97_25025 [Actinocrinis sp.]|uniref:hypothetical protein n=1 Tax=Actinocrinis sp. TaxID=1920516 RepID=UPI002DDCA410|nr:hypothetical protein [Actinocrinis sp.]HEV2347382.1 hypothetical protein [Actinocrinis sp.]
MDLEAALSAGGTLVAAVAAVGSWKAAGRSDKAATALTSIERDRWHAEMTPKFKITLKDPSMTRTVLYVGLEGPTTLSHLDTIEMTIRDDMPGRAELTAENGVSADEIRQQIWGPLRFVRGVDGGSSDGRTVDTFELPVGESRPFAVDVTLSPHWYSDPQAWRDQWDGTPLRLTLKCTREGFEPWTVKSEVPLSVPPRFQAW